jgi:para-nitrobenzyl esterase
VLTQSFRAKSGDTVFAYQFEQALPGKPELGAGHTFELPYVFGNLSPTGFLGGPFDDADRTLSEQMQTYWTNFAKTGDPNGKGLPDWKHFGTDAPNYMVFADGRVGGQQGLRTAACGLYRAHWAQSHAY